MKKTLLVIGVLALAALTSSCGGNSNNNAPAENNTEAPATEQCTEKKSDNCCSESADKPATECQSVDLTKKYICPNRDGSSDQPGTCEACGMDLIEN